MQDPCVLLVSDRRERADKLASAIRLIQPCAVVELGRPLPPGAPLAFLIDLSDPLPNTVWSEALTARTRTEAVPCLYLAKHGADDAEIRRFGSPTIIPAGSRSAGIISTLRRLMATARAAADGSARLDSQAEAATGIVTLLFDDAASDRAPSIAQAEKGTEIVLAAISEAGIRSWLDRLWQHHIGVYQHSLSVAGFAAAFGAELGFCRRDRHRLAQAALLHDIGKARIPAALLDKPGPLTPEETRVMREHPTIGADLLAEGGYEPAIVDVVRHHHERLDGSGYPDALKGSAVGDLVRLVAICDVHSALTERRSYRPALSGPQARRIMDGMTGQLDPDLLRAYAPIIVRAEGDIAPSARTLS